MGIWMDKTKHIHGTGMYIYVDSSTVFSLSYLSHLCKSFKSFKILVLRTSIPIAMFAYCYIPYPSSWFLFCSGHWYRNKIICDLFLCSSRKHLENHWKKYILFGASAVACNFWKGKVTIWAISVSVQRLPQGWVTGAGKCHLKNARRLLLSFLFVIIENEISSWCNFHILALPSPTPHSMQIIFTTVIQMIKGVLLMLNIMENFYQRW